MTPATIWTAVGAIAAVLALLGAMLALTFRIGALTGQLTSFMATYERDRSDILKDIGRIEERHERHVEHHDNRGYST
jgi:hypothetical protein